ncbi:TPA: autotransporter domain-containing protein, partial [Aeromonas veronii]
MHRSCSSLLQMLLPMLLALSGSTVKAATQDQEWAQERANAVLSLMTFTVVPDITASNLDIGSGTNQSAALNMTQIGGGATMSEAVPIYLEGAIGFSRYDPQFVVSNGTESRTLPTKWNSLTASGGIGWDVALHEDPRGGHWVLRPIANVSLGTMASDLRIGNWLLERTKGYSLDFLDGGQLNMYGLGGSLM